MFMIEKYSEKIDQFLIVCLSDHNDGVRKIGKECFHNYRLIKQDRAENLLLDLDSNI